MFGRKTKRELATAMAENAILRVRSATLQAELSEAQDRLVQSEGELRELRKSVLHQPL